MNDIGSDGAISKAEFEAWYCEWAVSIPAVPYDVLFGPYQPSSYWWFVQVLWLKLVINLLFTFGYYSSLNWHLWIHLVLASSIMLLLLNRPHLDPSSLTIEAIAMVCLSGVTHVVISDTANKGLSTSAMVTTVGLVCLPIAIISYMSVDTVLTFKPTEARAT
jgi:hypothetical protein